MATLDSLPRELRQHIFTLAFNHAIFEDHKLNANIRECIRSFRGFPRLVQEFYNQNEITYQLVDEVLGVGNNQLYLSEYPKTHAPYTHKLVFALQAVYPDLMDDVKQVLEKSLKGFEKVQLEVMK